MTTKHLIEMNCSLMTMQIIIEFEIIAFHADHEEDIENLNIMYQKVDIVG